LWLGKGFCTGNLLLSLLVQIEKFCLRKKDESRHLVMMMIAGSFNRETLRTQNTKVLYRKL